MHGPGGSSVGILQGVPAPTGLRQYTWAVPQLLGSVPLGSPSSAALITPHPPDVTRAAPIARRGTQRQKYAIIRIKARGLHNHTHHTSGSPTAMAASKLKQDETRVRRTKLLALRRQGIRYDDERIMNLGYASTEAARRDLNRALEQHRNEEAAEVSVYRQQENERLDDELARLADLEDKVRAILSNRHILVNNGRVILDPDTEKPMEDDAVILQAIDRLVKIEDARRRNAERRAKLNGLDMPAKAEVTGAGGGPLQMSRATTAELEALIGLNPAPSNAEGDDQDSSADEQ
ncbi:hypothetical protein GCM10010270_80200 [Streptomyces violaceus]|nr:hypothetical protein GCM10010270_80200 [Streptomyces janthinus]